MIITELKQPITNKDIIRKAQLGKIKIQDGMVIYFNTGLFWNRGVLVQGYEGCDLIESIDSIYNSNPDILRLWTYEEILELYNGKWLDDIIDENFIAVNGGEYYTDMINNVQFTDNSGRL